MTAIIRTMTDDKASIEASQISLAPNEITVNVIHALYWHFSDLKSNIDVNTTCNLVYK